MFQVTINAAQNGTSYSPEFLAIDGQRKCLGTEPEQQFDAQDYADWHANDRDWWHVDQPLRSSR